MPRRRRGGRRRGAHGDHDLTPPRAAVARPRPAVIAAIKTAHTLAWLSIEPCVLYVLCAGSAGRTGKRAGIAGAIVAGETLVFAANRFRCPLTELAERYGAQSGSVTDTYLPKWFAHNMRPSARRCSSS